MNVGYPANLKVSVAIVTYNHEPFITQAVESVLMQETDFEYEIIIGDDCSTDNTRNIVQSFGDNYPNIVHLILPVRNQGAHVNFLNILNACRGRYVALLDGDDYWTDPLKLQKQVDFLDNHPECVICYNLARVVDENDSEFSIFPDKVYRKPIATIEDLLISNFIATSSVLFRGGMFESFPEWYYKLPMGDWPLHVLNSQYGKIGLIKTVMSAYRIHSSGNWTGANPIWKYESMLSACQLMNTHLQYKYDRIIRSTIANIEYELANEYRNLGKPDIARGILLRMLVSSLFNRYFSRKKIVRQLFKLYTKEKNIRLFKTYGQQ